MMQRSQGLHNLQPCQAHNNSVLAPIQQLAAALMRGQAASAWFCSMHIGLVCARPPDAALCNLQHHSHLSNGAGTGTSGCPGALVSSVASWVRARQGSPMSGYSRARANMESKSSLSRDNTCRTALHSSRDIIGFLSTRCCKHQSSS
jgi:hypothetical protein